MSFSFLFLSMIKIWKLITWGPSIMMIIEVVNTLGYGKLCIAFLWDWNEN